MQTSRGETNDFMDIWQPSPRLKIMQWKVMSGQNLVSHTKIDAVESSSEVKNYLKTSNFKDLGDLSSVFVQDSQDESP